jgi:hypothetical protein
MRLLRKEQPENKNEVIPMTDMRQDQEIEEFLNKGFSFEERLLQAGALIREQSNTPIHITCSMPVYAFYPSIITSSAIGNQAFPILQTSISPKECNSPSSFSRELT